MTCCLHDLYPPILLSVTHQHKGESLSQSTAIVLTSSLLQSPFDLGPQLSVPSLFQPTAVTDVDAR
jgi:hypothetical protein